MNAQIPEQQKRAAENRQADSISPQSEIVKPETGQDGRSWHFNVETILMVDQSEIACFVHEQTFEAVVIY